jgi:hypothetical protein
MLILAINKRLMENNVRGHMLTVNHYSAME